MQPFSLMIMLLVFNFILFLLPSIVIFKWRNIDIIRKRNVSLILAISTTSCIYTLNLITGFNAFSETKLPCIQNIIIAHALSPLLSFCVSIKALQLIYENCRTRIQLSMNFEADSAKKCKFSSIEKFTGYFFDYFRRLSFLKKRVNSSAPNSSTSTQSKLTITTIESRFQGEVSNQTTLFIILLFLLFLVPFTLVILFINQNVIWQLNCLPISVAPAAMFVFVHVLIICYTLSNICWIKDGLNLVNEIILICVTVIIMLVPLTVTMINESFAIPELGYLFYVYWAIINLHCISILLPIYKVLCFKFQKSINSATRLDYDAAIKNPLVYAVIRDMLAKEFCLENALFIEHLQKIKNPRMCSSMDASDTSNDVPLQRRILMDYTSKHIQELFEKYIEEGSPFELNLSNVMRESVKASIHDYNYGGFNLFDQVLECVHTMIYENTYFRYVQSKDRQHGKDNEHIYI